mmetsp:Transcript_1097/g.1526  ORF Transcript_1097/g.1526 Transcript_1097/m.1526 type:complete len:116 (+) Transcript_1097:40-387(+)
MSFEFLRSVKSKILTKFSSTSIERVDLTRSASISSKEDPLESKSAKAKVSIGKKQVRLSRKIEKDASDSSDDSDSDGSGNETLVALAQRKKLIPQRKRVSRNVHFDKAVKKKKEK